MLAYKRVGYTELVTKDGRHLRVSTVWLGFDHSFFGGGPPLIFETMVFEGDSFEDQDCARYSTEEEALEGHEVMVEKWRNEAPNADP